MANAGVLPAATPLAYSAPITYSAALNARSLAYSPSLLSAPAPAVYTAVPHAESPVIAAGRIVTVPRAAPIVAAAPVLATRTEYTDAYPQYQYAYNVQDALTGDSKTQEESREGDVVRGSYSLIEPDGSRRIVNYYADPINGFNAVVQKDVPVVSAPVVTAKTIVA